MECRECPAEPLGVLDLAGLIEPGPDALRQVARLLSQARGGWLLVEQRVLSAAMSGIEDRSRPVRLVGQAVALGIVVEPNPLHLGVSPGDDAVLADNLRAHAAVRAPAFAEIYRTPAGRWRDGATGRHLDCRPDEGVLQAIRSFLDHPLEDGAPRPRLHTTCAASAVFRPAGDCKGFACTAEVTVDLPCLAVYPPQMPLADLAVPLPGR